MTGLSVLETLLIHRPGKLAEVLGAETGVICGSQRGNTSAVAYSLYNLGYFLGENLGSLNYEDSDVLALLPDPALKAHFSKEAFSAFVSNRNARYARWAFKIPHASGYVRELSKSLRNPVFVICFRNPAAVMQSIFRREGRRVPLEKSLEIAQRPISAALDILNSTDAPAVFIDTDKINQRPKAFLREIGDTLGLKGDFERVLAGISSKGYKSSAAQHGVTLKPQ